MIILLWDRFGTFVIRLAFILAVAVFVIAPLQALAWSKLPFPGFVVEHTLVVSNIQGRGWTGHAAGIDYPQHLVSVAERPVTNRAEFHAALSQFKADQIIPVVTELPDHTRLVCINVACIVGTRCKVKVEETELPEYFGDWLKLRRNELDLTQAELALRAGSSVPALRKIESGDRRPSKQLAGLLAKSLEIPSEDQATFIRVARGESNIERLPPPTYATPGANKATIKTSRSPGNLPSMLNPFIGRELELTALGQLLCDPRCRLLTLTGPGGIGKTRLAIEVDRCHKDLFPDGIWLIPLPRAAARRQSPMQLVMAEPGHA